MQIWLQSYTYLMTLATLKIQKMHLLNKFKHLFQPFNANKAVILQKNSRNGI